MSDARLQTRAIHDRITQITDQLYTVTRILRDIVKEIDEEMTAELYAGSNQARVGYRIAKLEGKGKSLGYTIEGAIAATNKIRQVLDQYMDLYEAFEITDEISDA